MSSGVGSIQRPGDYSIFVSAKEEGTRVVYWRGVRIGIIDAREKDGFPKSETEGRCMSMEEWQKFRGDRLLRISSGNKDKQTIPGS